MRGSGRARKHLLVATLAMATIAGVACTGGGGDSRRHDRHNRGGAVNVTMSSVEGFEPADGITAIGSFFAPPGPAPSPWSTVAECAWTTPLPEERATPSPTPTPDVDWRDAGDVLTLRSEGNALGLARFEGPNGEIYYLAPADAEPDSFPLDVAYDVEIEGSASANGVKGETLPAALVAPHRLDLYAPELAGAPITLPRTALQVGWVPGDSTDVVKVTVIVSGSAGSATLTCTSGDTGFFEVAGSQMELFPSGGGTLTVTRRSAKETKLADDTWLEAEVVLVEGGAILLP